MIPACLQSYWHATKETMIVKNHLQDKGRDVTVIFTNNGFKSLKFPEPNKFSLLFLFSVNPRQQTR